MKSRPKQREKDPGQQESQSESLAKNTVDSKTQKEEKRRKP